MVSSSTRMNRLGPMMSVQATQIPNISIIIISPPRVFFSRLVFLFLKNRIGGWMMRRFVFMKKCLRNGPVLARAPLLVSLEMAFLLRHCMIVPAPSNVAKYMMESLMSVTARLIVMDMHIILRLNLLSFQHVFVVTLDRSLMVLLTLHAPRMVLPTLLRLLQQKQSIPIPVLHMFVT